MKKLIKLRALFILSASALLFTLFSFSSNPGGEGFEVFKNNKLVLQQFGGEMKNVKTLQLNNVNATDQITIKYYHCGRTGNNRHLIARSNDNKELKNWQFANMSTNDQGMSFRPADVLPAKGKCAATTVNVYYTSKEIPQERLLLTLQLNS